MRIGAAAPLEVEILDVTDLPLGSAEARARELLGERAQVPFDLGRGPLHHICLIAVGPNDHLLMILMHHAVSDDWSYGILLRELRTAYRGMRRGLTVDLPQLPIQPADYSAWQRKQFGANELDEQYLYWRKRLRGITNLALPTDRPLQVARNWLGSRVELPMSEETLREVFESSVPAMAQRLS